MNEKNKHFLKIYSKQTNMMNSCFFNSNYNKEPIANDRQNYLDSYMR